MCVVSADPSRQFPFSTSRGTSFRDDKASQGNEDLNSHVWLMQGIACGTLLHPLQSEISKLTPVNGVKICYPS